MLCKALDCPSDMEPMFDLNASIPRINNNHRGLKRKTKLQKSYQIQNSSVQENGTALT